MNRSLGAVLAALVIGAPTAGGRTVFRGSAENGPWLVVDVPPGSCDITAVQDGKSRTAKGVRVAAGQPRTVVLTWKVADVDMGL